MFGLTNHKDLVFREDTKHGFGTFAVHINILDVSSAFIPNVVTADDNTMNDFFKLPELLLGAEIDIFDRWGKPFFIAMTIKTIGMDLDCLRVCIFIS